MKNKITLLALALLAVSCAGIEPLNETPPEGLPAGSEVETVEAIEEAPDDSTVDVDLKLSRTLPDRVYAGEEFEVILNAESMHGGALEILLVEPVRNGLSYLQAPKPYTINYEGLEVKLLRWRETLNPGEARTYKYRVQAERPGTVTLPPASINDQYGNTFESKPMFIKIVCRPDGKCGDGETYINCPADCPTGSGDDICDGVEDGRIDPDCRKDADPDAKKTETTTTSMQDETTPTKNPGPCNLLLLPILSLTSLLAFKTTIP